jgi:hypothetical protein
LASHVGVWTGPDGHFGRLPRRFLKNLPQGVDQINNICLAQRQGPAQDVETVRRIVQVSVLIRLCEDPNQALDL